MKRPNNPQTGRSISVLLGLAAITMATHWAAAHPYATSLTNNAGTVSFRLNEPADEVEILWNNRANKKVLGAVQKGLTITNVGATSPFEVKVTKTGSGAPTLISDNANRLNQFEYPRGVFVNRRPASPYFGRIYVANGRTSPTATGRPMGDGIYVLNSDHTDALGQGDSALTGGLDFTTGGNFAPWKITVGEDDDYLYITDWSDPTGNLYRTDPNVSAGSGQPVLKPSEGSAAIPVGAEDNHGSIPGAAVAGSLAAGNLTVFTVDEDYQTDPLASTATEVNSLWRYDIGATPLPYATPPTFMAPTPALAFAANQADLARATNGYLYQLHYRSAGGENLVQVVDPSGAVLWKSRDKSLELGYPRDMLSNSVSIAVSRDMRFLALLRTAGQVVVLPMVDGIPDIEARVEWAAVGGNDTGRQVAFDAANNVVVVDNVTERLRVYSLGKTTTAITKSNPAGNGGEGGDFSITSPAGLVEVASDITEASESSAGATLTISRSGFDSIGQPLTVAFTNSGVAVRGSDYELRTNNVVVVGDELIIPAGSSSVVVTLAPINDSVAELTEAATVAIAGTTDYSVGTQGSVSVNILDNEAPVADVVIVSGFDSMYERITEDYARLRIVRRGDISQGTLDVNITYSGTAVNGTDYNGIATVAVDPGVVNQNFDIKPIDDALLEGNETFTVSVAAGTGYSVGTNSPSVTVTIRDDERPAETVLFSDNFNQDTSANWSILFGSGNAIDDFRALWAIDYASGILFPSIPMAPHSTSDALGLYVTVNKDEPSALGAAGINLYPKNKTFSGDYAVRFDMYLMVGSGSSTTEYALMGINHSGTKTNWFRNSAGGVPGGSFDGLFFGVEADAAALGDYVIYSSPTTAGNNPTALTPGVNATAMRPTFKVPPYSYAGAPGVSELSATPTWSDVEISHIGSVVTLTINGSVVMRYTNATPYTVGNIMLGYTDAYDSVMVGNSGVIYDNLRVVSVVVPTLEVSNIQRVGNNMELSFSFNSDEPATAFSILSSTTANGSYTTDASATITKLGVGTYKAVLPMSGTSGFYRVSKN